MATGSFTAVPIPWETVNENADFDTAVKARLLAQGRASYADVRITHSSPGALALVVTNRQSWTVDASANVTSVEVTGTGSATGTTYLGQLRIIATGTDVDVTLASATLAAPAGTLTVPNGQTLSVTIAQNGGGTQFQALVGDIVSAQISDSTAAGRALLTAADAPTQLSLIGASASGHAHAGVYEPANALLASIRTLSMVADRYIYGTAGDTVALGVITAFMRTLLDDADQATARTTLGAQPLDATLTALANLTIAANSYIRGTGADAFAVDTAAASTIVARRATGNLGAQTYANMRADLAGLPQTVNAQSGTTYTLATTALGNHVLTTLTNAAAKTVNIDTTSIAFVNGNVAHFLNLGAGDATFAGLGGLQLDRKSTQTLVLPQYGGASVFFHSDTSATLVGGMTAV